MKNGTTFQSYASSEGIWVLKYLCYLVSWFPKLIRQKLSNPNVLMTWNPDVQSIGIQIDRNPDSVNSKSFLPLDISFLINPGILI